MKRYKSVDDYIDNATIWREQLAALRQILRATALDETVKWGAPCYTYRGKNVVGIGGFKSYFGLWFFQGALLPDKNKVLISAQEGKTKALRQWRMHSASDIKPAVIKRYVKDAIQVVETGREIKVERSRAVVVPPELQNALRRCKGATAAFRALSNGRQREYADYVVSAKRNETKARRIEKILPMIVAGKGLNDHYRG